MAKLDRVEQAEVRANLGRARDEIRAGDATGAVHSCWEAFAALAASAPDLLQKPRPGPPGAPAMKLVMLWPELGANLDKAAAERGDLTVTYDKDVFSLSEAMTYYEFVLDTALELTE
jgi:hypothetical protein